MKKNILKLSKPGLAMAKLLVLMYRHEDLKSIPGLSRGSLARSSEKDIEMRFLQLGEIEQNILIEFYRGENPSLWNSWLTLHLHRYPDDNELLAESELILPGNQKDIVSRIAIRLRSME